MGKLKEHYHDKIESGLREIKDGDVVFDPQFREVFTYSYGDRFIKDRLRHATEEEKQKLKESGKDFVEIK